MIDEKLLKNTRLFRDLSTDQIRVLLKDKQTMQRAYKKGQIVHHEFERCDALDLIIEGVLDIQKLDSDGHVFTVASFASQEIIGANVLFATDNHYPMTVTAQEDTTVLHLKKTQILSLCKESDVFLQAILMLISNKTTALTRRIDELVNKSIRERITQYFIFERYAQGSQTIFLNMSKKTLAERFGIQRSSLSRELGKMRDEGLIDFKNRDIELKEEFFLKMNEQFVDRSAI